MAAPSYELVAPSRRCAQTGRELAPGTPIFSVLYDRDGQWVREEIAADAWAGPPPEAFSFWRTAVPTEKRKGPPRLNEELLWECFRRLEGQSEPKQQNFRYVLALLLLRKKRLKFEGMGQDGPAERLLLRDVKRKETHAVVNPLLTEEQLREVESEIEQLIE